MKESEIKSKFCNERNVYYGHGIGPDNEKVVKLIFENGLRCSHEQLYFTTECFGQGEPTLFEESVEEMNHWEHKDSKQIIIASLPLAYHLLEVRGTPLYGKRQAAFYHFISPEQSDKSGISSGFYLKPEFVMGVYDANQKDFISNEKYYENLPEKEQNNLMNEVKKKYIDILMESGFSFSEYSQFLEVSNIKNPLTKEEIEEGDKILDFQKAKQQVRKVTENLKISDFDKTTQQMKNQIQENPLTKEVSIDDEW